VRHNRPARAIRQARVLPDVGKPNRACQCAALWLLALSGFGCVDERPAIEAKFQEISFDEQPALQLDQSAVAVSAHASSGLPVTYQSLTPNTCSADRQSGLVTGEVSGTCSIEADQLGNAEFGPARPATQSVTFRFSDSLRFESALSLGLYDTVTTQAVNPAGNPITYSTTTPSVCSIDAKTGVVVALALGTCTVTATSGEVQISQSATIEASNKSSTPSPPTGVTATFAGTTKSVIITAQSTASGGSPITEYSAASTPNGITAKSMSLPVVVTCPAGCTGYAFALVATNSLGSSAPSVAADVIANYGVTAVFHEPDTQPNDSIFVGRYLFNATKFTVTGLIGRLSEAMTGSSSPYPNDTMNWLMLNHQLSAQSFEAGDVKGLLVTTFLLPTTNTLASNPAFGGTDGWTPGTGMGLYYGYPGTNPANAYVRVFVSTQDPSATPSTTAIDKLAYADCTPGGMMGASCMTGTSNAGYGSLGTMSGYPVSQVTVQQ